MLPGAVVDDVEGHALEGEEEGQRHHERRDAHLRSQDSDQQADDHTGQQRGRDGERPRPVVADHQSHHDCGADTSGEAGGEVDLAEQQREHETHREQDRAGALGEHVAEVVETQEGRLDDGEQDHEDDQPGGRGQRAHLAAPDPLDVEPEVVTRRVGSGHCRGDGGQVLAGGVHLGCLPRALVVEAGHADAPSRRPVVMSSTSCCWLTSAARDLRGHLAEVEHRDAVGDLQHLVHVVRDEDDGEAAVCEASYEAEHLGGLRHPEGGGGLVEHDHLGVPEHRLGDRHGLPLTAGQAGHPLADRPHGAHGQRPEGLLGRLLHAALVEREAAAPFTAEEHVLDDVEVVAQREVLVDDLDAEGAGVARRVDGDRAALEQVVAGVDGVGAADALDERRLARAVVADECSDLAGLGAEVDALEDIDRVRSS